MKLFSKRTTLLALVLAVLMVFAACAPTAPGPDNSGNSGEVTVKKPEDIKIFVEHFSKTVEVAMQWRQGALRAGEELGIQVDVNGAEDASAEKNIALLQQAIAQEYDGIASIALVSDSYGAVYDEAAARGIPVMTYHMDAPDSERVAYFGPNQQSYAQAAARFMADEMGKEGKVITIQGTPSDTEAMIIDEFEAELKRYAPNCTVVTKINDTVDPAKAYRRLRLRCNPIKTLKGFSPAHRVAVLTRFRFAMI